MQGAILTIGSLLWDDGTRAEWRREHLHIDRKICVKVPIGYGRRSQTRGNTFTMTFTLDGPAGQGVLVPCTEPIVNVGSLVAEAEALWSAEQPTASSPRIGAEWGCVGVLCRAETESAHLLQEWARHFRDIHTFAVSPVDERGMLRIPWPVKATDGAPAEADVVLATATKAEVVRPCAEEIADAWLGQNKGHERYFFENVLHGIRTPDDGLIWKRIEEQGPCWLSNDAYTEAVTILRREATAHV